MSSGNGQDPFGVQANDTYQMKLRTLTLFNAKTFDESNFESIIGACIKQDTRAQNMLYKKYFGYSKSICLRYSSNQDEAKDILNKAFYKVFINLEKYDKGQPFKAWLRKIIVNTALNYYRDNKKTRLEESIDLHEEINYNENVIDHLAAEDLLRLVQQLPPAYRMVFVMHVVDGCNHREIADELGINEGTSRSNFMKARLKLQQMIKSNHPETYASFGVETKKIEK